jgi:cytochrome P460
MFRRVFLTAIVVCLSFGLTQQTPAQSVVPKYDGNKLLFPDGFRSWIFVGSNVGLAYDEEIQKLALRAAKQADKPLFHNIYLNPESYARFRDTNQFPDPTILVMDMFASATSEPQHIVTKGSYNGDWMGNLVAVKNSARPAGPKGEKTIWAYYIFSPDPAHRTQPVASAAAEEDGMCYTCHQHNGLKDNVWVQFYPALRDLLKR